MKWSQPLLSADNPQWSLCEIYVSKFSSLSHKKYVIFSGRHKKGRKSFQLQSVNGSRNDTATTFLGWTKLIDSCKNLWQSRKSAVGNKMKLAIAVDWQRTVITLWNLWEQVYKFKLQKDEIFAGKQKRKDMNSITKCKWIKKWYSYYLPRLD